MTLTLPETLKAIQALDTEQDIIRQACEGFLSSLGLERVLAQRSDLIAKQILELYADCAPVEELMFACCMVAGRIGGTMAKFGTEEKVYEGLAAIMGEELANTAASRLTKALKRALAKAAEKAKE